MNVGYHSARTLGGWVRAFYGKRLAALCGKQVETCGLIAAEVYSFSGKRDLPEQVASLRSFLRYTGVPVRFTVISDGSHGPVEEALLKSIHPCVAVQAYHEIFSPDLPQAVRDLAERHVLGKKLGLLMSLPHRFPVIFTDSDILFSPGAGRVGDWCKSGGENYALQDCGPVFSPALALREEEKTPPLNSGFLILNRPVDWDKACERLKNAGAVGDHWTEQTIVHLAWKLSGGDLLPTQNFVVRRDDEFIFRDLFAGEEMFLRHYVSPVRHKFWVRLAGARFWRG